jgi:hypothetical protein
VTLGIVHKPVTARQLGRVLDQQLNAAAREQLRWTPDMRQPR